MRHFPSYKLKIDAKHVVMLQMWLMRNEKGQLWKPAGLETCDDVNVEDQLKDEPEEQTGRWTSHFKGLCSESSTNSSGGHACACVHRRMQLHDEPFWPLRRPCWVEAKDWMRVQKCLKEMPSPSPTPILRRISPKPWSVPKPCGHKDTSRDTVSHEQTFKHSCSAGVQGSSEWF